MGTEMPDTLYISLGDYTVNTFVAIWENKGARNASISVMYEPDRACVRLLGKIKVGKDLRAHSFFLPLR